VAAVNTNANSACHPYGLRGEGLVRLIGAVVCPSCCAAGSLSAIAGNEWLHIALRYH